MKRTFLNDLYASFTLYFENRLNYYGDAYSNVNYRLYSIKDDKLKAYSVYGSPWKQWVYDYGIAGAQIPSGVYSNGTFIPRGQSGLKIDFNNGRIIFSGNVNIPVSGQFSPKEFNVYNTTKSDEELLFEQRYDLTSQFPQVPSGIPSDKIVAPAAFIRFGSMTTEPFTIGGEYDSKINARVIVLSDSNTSLDAVGNLFVDQKHKNFLVFSKTPLNEYGDLKTGYYSYFDYLDQYFDSRKMVYLEDVDFSKPNLANTQNPDLKVGILDFQLSLPRLREV